MVQTVAKLATWNWWYWNKFEWTILLNWHHYQSLVTTLFFFIFALTGPGLYDFTTFPIIFWRNLVILTPLIKYATNYFKGSNSYLCIKVTWHILFSIANWRDCEANMWNLINQLALCLPHIYDLVANIAFYNISQISFSSPVLDVKLRTESTYRLLYICKVSRDCHQYCFTNF